MAFGIKEARKITAILLTLIMISASVSIPAFADSSDGVMEIARLKQAMDTAKEAADDAKAEMDQAEKDMNPLKSDWEDKKNEADQAAKDAAAAESALKNAEKARDEAFESRKTQAGQALSAAQTAYDNAVSAFEAAKKAVTDKEGSLADAKNRKSSLETEIQNLTSEKETAQNTIDSLPSQIAQAESTLESANSRWEQEKQEAADAVSAAQAAYDEAGYDFLNNKINALGPSFYTLDEMIEICKGYTGKNLKNPCTFNGRSINTISDVANDDLFMSIVKSNCTKDNLLFAMDMIDESNSLRQAEGKSVMGVSYQLMGAAIMSNSYTLYSFGHDLYNTNGKDANGYTNTDSFWAIGPATWGNENLHAYSARIPSAEKPFEGWYYEEKEALQQAVDSGRWPGLSMDMSTRYIWTNYPNLSTETKNAGYGQVGHYLTLKNEEYTTTGMAVTYNSGSVPTSWRGRATQSFNDDTVNSISVNQCRAEINSAFHATETALNNALSEQQALETKPDYVTSAEAALQEKQEALQQAQQTVTEKTNAIKDKNTELENVKAEIVTLTDELSTAEQNKTTKENEKNTALEKLNAATAANTKAQALNVKDPATYDDDQELKDLVKACSNAQESLSDTQKTAETKQNEANDAKSLYEEAKAVYDQKKELYDAAVADYNSAKKAYNAAANISNSTITVANQTYSGNALKPAPKVVLSGKELVKGTDYTVKYSANTNVGIATVTVTGKGDYFSSVSKKFTIKARAITPTVTLSKKAFAYNGKVQTPSVTVKDGTKKLVNKTDYTITYASGRKNAGVYTIKVKLKGNYSGSKKISYKINPKGTSISKLSKSQKAFTVTWKKQSKKMASKYIGGYQIQYSRNKSFKSGNTTVGIAGYKKASRKVSGLKAKTKYYVRVRTYMKVGKSTLYSPWSSVKAVTTPAAKKAKSSTSAAAAAAAAAAASAKGSTVYWTPNGSVYHVSKNCSTLSRSKTIYSGTISESNKPRVCKVCGN